MLDSVGPELLCRPATQVLTYKSALIVELLVDS